MDETQRLEIAARITELRERSPHTQPKMAEKLGITLRAYQKLEARGTTHFERCEEVAGIHREWTQRDPAWSHVDANWIWDGRVQGETPDLVGMLNGDRSQLDRIEELLEAVAEHLGVETDPAKRMRQRLRREAQQGAERPADKPADTPRRKRRGQGS